MRILEFFQDKYTVIFVLLLVLLVSVWVSRTYRNGGFSSWIAPSEGYGSGVIEGFDQSLAVTTILETFNATSHGQTPAVASATAGELVLNKCERIVNKDTTFRFIFKHTTTSAATENNREFVITLPDSYIQNTTNSDLTIRLREFPGTTVSADKKSSDHFSGKTIEETGSTNIVLTRPETTGSVKIVYKLKPTTEIKSVLYTLEITKLKWVSTFNTPTAASSLVTLSSSMEPVESNRLVAIQLWNDTTASKQVKIFANTTFDLLPEFGDCRKITTTPMAELVERDDSTTASTTRSQTVFKLKFMLTNPFGPLDLMMIQLPNLSRVDGTNFYVKIIQGTNSFASFKDQIFDAGTTGTLPYATFKLAGGSDPVLANTLATLYIYGLRTPDIAVQIPLTDVKIRTFSFNTVEQPGAQYNFSSTNFLDAGEYTSPTIAAKSSTGIGSTSSGTASDGTSYVASSSSSALISDVKRQMNWAIEAQNEYDSAYKALRAATTTKAKTDAELRFDVAVARRNRLIASHPDSWYDGANWRYGDDGHVRKCVEPSNLSSNEGNCQNVYRMDVSGNLVKSADGNNVVLMRKCPWKCNNPGQSGSDSCRIDADCLKVIRWATYLPDGTQIERNLLATTRSKYDDIARDTNYSSLDEEDIYRRGITRNFRGYGRRPKNLAPGEGYPAHGNSPGLFGTIRDAAGNIIRSVGNWIDPNDPAANKRTNRHNAYYYEDGSPAATAYLGKYNGQGYDEESPFYAASKPTNYYYTTNYYYSDANTGDEAAANGEQDKSNVKPYEQSINL